MKHIDSVPDKYKDTFLFAQAWIGDHKEFLKHPDWDLYGQTSETKMYTRVSPRKYLCLKSVAVIHENL